MNLGTAHPLIRWAVLCFMILLTKLKIIHPLLPSSFKEKLLWGWDNYMMWYFITHFGKKMYFDQYCTMDDPASFKPLVEVKNPKNGFSEEEIKEFYRKGFYGPIDVFTPEQMAEMRKDISEVLLERKSKVYALDEGINRVEGTNIIDKEMVRAAYNGRDRHLDCFEIWNVINQEPIKERIACLLGPDLLLWRSQFFNKTPGAPAVTWHAASTYMSELLNEPVLRPKDINKAFQITTWVAIDDADIENGCMHFCPGTHRQFAPMAFTNAGLDDPEGKFAGLAIKSDVPGITDFPLKDELYTSGKVVAVPLKAGQAVMFFERCVHASPPNNSKTRRRMAITFRVCRTDVKIYGSRKWHGVTYLNAKFDLNNWRALPYRGNPGTLNPIAEPPKPRGK